MDPKNCEEETSELRENEDSANETIPESKSFLKNITLEFLWIGFMIPLAIEIVIFKNIYIERACLVDLGLPANSCDIRAALDSTIEKNAQQVVTSISVKSSMVYGFISCITVLFCGPWCDTTGRRKPLMLLATFSNIASTLGLLFTLFIADLSVAWILYFKAVLSGLGGALCMMAAYSYLGDICFSTKRCPTIVMGRNGFAMYVSFVTGCLIAPFLNQYLGFIGLMLFVLTLQIFAVIYIYLKVHDVNVTNTRLSVFNIALPLEVFRCVFKKREGYKRTILLLMMIIPSANSIIGANETSLRYLYLRNTFGWTDKDYASLLATRQTINSVGILTIVIVFKKILKMKDEVIGLMGGISEVTDALIFMNINKVWMLYATALFGILSSGPITVERPIINKFIAQNEQGKINSCMAILDIFFSFATSPVSNFIYSQTLSIFPSCFMIISVFGSVVIILCYSFVYRLCSLEKRRVEDIKMNVLPNT